jgi:multidrug efflux system membrane fusion protein
MLKKLIKLLFILAIIAGIFYYFLLGGGPKGGQMGMGGAPEITVYAAPEQEVVEFSEFSGRLEATDYVEVKPKVSGTIEQIHFKDGAVVKKGQALFTIEPAPYAAELERAKGSAVAADSAYKNASEDFKRAEKLFEAKAISKQEYDSKQAAYKAASGNASSAAGALKLAKISYGYSTVTAPISGKISRAEVTKGNTVQAGPSAPIIATIVAATPIYASFEMDENNFLSYIQGRKAEDLAKIPVTLLLNGAEIEGKIHSFDNQLNPATSSLRVRAVFENKDGSLIPGLFAKVKIGSAEKIKHVLVSEKSIGTDQRKKFVLAVGSDGKTEYKEVVLGAYANGYRIVKSGLNAGDKVVYTGLAKLKPGMPITPKVIDFGEVK